MTRVHARADVAACGDGFTLKLNGRPIKTPAGLELRLPTRALAEALAAEWDALPKDIKPHTLPLTGLCNAALDHIAKGREAQVDAILRYAETDLLCYRATRPAALVTRQNKAWQPLLDWAQDFYGAPLRVATGVTPVAQPEASLNALRRRLEELDAFRLVGVSQAAAVAGSLIIALALLEGDINAHRAHQLSQIDETFQTETWGEDDEARRRRAVALADMQMAERLLALL